MAPRSLGAKVTRGAAMLALAQPLTWAATLAFVALVPHYLGARGFGMYAVVSNAATIAGAIISLGVPIYLTRRVAAASADDAGETDAALLIALGGSALVAVALSQLYALSGAAAGDVLVARLALAGMVVSTGQSVLYARLNGCGQHGHYAALNAASSLAVVGAQLAVLALGGGLVGMFAVGLATAVAIFLATWQVAGRPGLRVAAGFGALRRVAQGSLPFLAGDIVLRVRGQIDIVLVGILARAGAAGQLAAAYQIIGIPVFIPTMIAIPLLPALSDPSLDRKAFRAALEHSVLAVFMLTVPLSAGIAALAPAIPALMHWSAEFRAAVLPMQILVLEPPLVAVDMVLGTAIIALRRERPWLAAAVAAATFNILGNVVAVPAAAHLLGNGAAGAAIVEDGTELVMLAAALLLIPRDLLSARLLGLMARVVAAAALVVAVAAPLRTVSLPLAVAAGGVVYTVALVALRALQVADVQTLVGHLVPRLAARWHGAKMLRNEPPRAWQARPAVDNQSGPLPPAALRPPWQPASAGSATVRASALLHAARPLDCAGTN